MSVVARLKSPSLDPVAGGFYTVREASRLLNIPQTQRITAWLQGHPGSASGPIIKRQYDPLKKIQELGFWDLLEVRFVDHFRAQGVSLQALRKAANTARELWQQEHPFATSAKFMTDRKAVFITSAEETQDNVLLNLVTKQYEMYAAIIEVLSRGIDFDHVSQLAREWKPRPKEFPSVALNPKVAYGQPAVSGVPTEVIYKQWKAEDGSYAAVSDWFEVKEALVKEAVEFELGLPN